MPDATPSAIFFASDEPRQLASFYQDVLELPPSEATGDSVGMRAGALHLGFEQRTAPDSPRVTLWFDVENVTATIARLVERGGRVVSPPDAACSPGEILATAEDIDGNLVGFIAPRV